MTASLAAREPQNPTPSSPISLGHPGATQPGSGRALPPGAENPAEPAHTDRSEGWAREAGQGGSCRKLLSSASLAASIS